MASSHKFWGISKGSKRFPFPERFVDPDTLTSDQAQVEYDFLRKRYQKAVRGIARDIESLHIETYDDLTEEIIGCREQLKDIEKRIYWLADMYPEVVR